MLPVLTEKRAQVKAANLFGKAKTFLVVVLLATITLINFLAALHGYRSSMARAEQLFDAQLADIAEVLAVTVGNSATDPAVVTGALVDAPGIAFQVWHNDVLIISSQHNLLAKIGLLLLPFL